MHADIMEAHLTAFLSVRLRLLGAALACSTLLLATAGTASAQTTVDPNPGALSVTTGVDVPSVYFFRGIRQETEPKFTMFPYADGGIALFSGGGAIKSASVNFGVWNSLHTGSSGGDGPGQIHYEEDFYSTLTLGFARGLTVGTTFTAYTSPNQIFNTVQELSLKVASATKFAPYGLVAFELSGQADGGSNEGTYAEFGIAPSWPLAGSPVSLTIPVKVGLSLKDYYENPAGDEKFGYFDGGALLTVPITKIPSRFGSWNVHGGLNFMRFGETTRLANKGDASQVIVSGGIGMSY